MKKAPIRRAIKPFIPKFILIGYQKARLAINRVRYGRLSTADAFRRIYATNAWGGAPGEFSSGTGSQDEFTDKYCEYISREIRNLSEKSSSRISVVDLGCGDFRVGSKLVGPHIDYLGIDVVEPLVERNQREFGRDGVEFRCVDIVTDELPKANVALVRQVFQHLSNSEIIAVLPKLRVYDFVFVTEHYPNDERNTIPNRDKTHGPDIRLYDNSAVYLDKTPFSLPGVELCLSVEHGDNCGILKTFCIRK